MSESLTNPQIRKLKSLAQRLEPVLKLGKAGVTDGFVQSVQQALEDHELIKIKFVDHKDEKKQLAPQLAERSQSQLIMRVGNVAVFYRQQADPARRRIAI
jgi:RNA-binding protein